MSIAAAIVIPARVQECPVMMTWGPKATNAISPGTTKRSARAKSFSAREPFSEATILSSVLQLERRSYAIFHQACRPATPVVPTKSLPLSTDLLVE